MARILFWVFIVFLVWFLVRWAGAMRRRRAPGDATPATGHDRSSAAVESMRQCAWCGAHMPSHDALALSDGRVYCSAPHRDAAIHADQAAAAAPGRDA